ncbi:lactose-binding lectin l-2-like [Xiphophorus hellerii]|uniref:lactose-binding lectin l-2-like n=1 Tax=Xiphophorus hellerii TaxID=8084 RepID=UPI0013B36582|nr:lactose-binding lectin l-2-like [Xiphophorus hellerii]
MLLLVFFLALGLAAELPSDGNEVKLLRGNCPMFWYSFTGRCYKYLATDMTWAEAELYCVSQGANLVSVHSAAEDDFVKSLIKNFDPAEGRTWIGLSDLHYEKGWMWSDGSAARFFAWSALQPDNGSEAEHCVHTNYIGDKKWNDVPCSVHYPFICVIRTTGQ